MGHTHLAEESVCVRSEAEFGQVILTLQEIFLPAPHPNHRWHITADVGRTLRMRNVDSSLGLYFS